MEKQHRIRLPKQDCSNLAQNESFFYFADENGERKIRFHDYDELYKVPGLYEQLFYDRLKCQSPNKVVKILQEVIAQSNFNFSELRVLDLGAGNGMVGELFKKVGVSRIIGVDIIKEALQATERDRPGVYDDYYIADFCNLSEKLETEIASWSLNCMVTVAALGFDDIPPKAFVEAFNITQSKGWIAFNIKESFLDNSDKSGFSKTIRELIFSEYLDIHHLTRYLHRYSINGEPLYYFAVAGLKKADIPKDFLELRGIEI